MKRQLGSVLVDADEITRATSLAERHPEHRTDKRPMISDLRESDCLTANTRILRLPLVWSLDERKRMVARPMAKVFSSGRRECSSCGWRPAERWRRRRTIRS